MKYRECTNLNLLTFVRKFVIHLPNFPKLSDDEDKPVDNWPQVGLLFLMRVVDAALLPWFLAEVFILVLVWLFARNLNSKDTLVFISKLLTLQGFAWCGWILFMLAIPIFRAIYKQGSVSKDEMIRRLESENERARKLLSKKKLNELDLNEPTP
jgi:hypothetical protein